MKLIRYLDSAGRAHHGSEQPDGSALRIEGDVYGAHRVTAERERQRFFERELTIPRGTAAIVDVSLIVSESVVVQKELVEVARTREPADDGSSVRKRRLRRWSAVAAGVVAVGAGVAVAVVLAKPEAKTEAPVAGTLTPGVLTWK